MSKKITIATPPTGKYNKEQGWHANTDLGCNVKTMLRSDCKMKAGKEYQGVFRLDVEADVEEFLSHDAHYTFTETSPLWTGRRNPRIFDGRHITCTRRENGEPRLNFKQLNIGADFSVERYALEVYNEICLALEGLVEK